MRIKVRIFSALLAFAMLLFVTACSGEKKPANVTTEESSKQTVSESTSKNETTAPPETPTEPSKATESTETETPAETTTSPVTTEKKAETTVPSASEKVTEKPKKQTDNFTIKLYTDMNSKSYNSLKEPEATFNTGIGGVYSDEYMRFVCNADDVVVTLVELSFNDFRGEFDESNTAFSIKTKKGAVYEFKAYLGETMPPAKLKAEKGNYAAEFLLQMNGKDARRDFTIKGAKKPN